MQSSKRRARKRNQTIHELPRWGVAVADGQYGHVKISRKAFDAVEGDKLWLERRRYSMWEAWVDCIQMAAWKPHERVVGATVVELQRGEFLASVRYLAQRWGWSEKKVWTFLGRTISDRLTFVKESQKGNVYRVVNYDAYQSNGNSEETARKQRGNKEEADKANKAFMSPTDLLFDTVWFVYPKKEGKKAAKKAWDKAIVRNDPKEIDAGIRRYVAQKQAMQTELQFYKNLATFLNGEAWKEEWVLPATKPMLTASAGNPLFKSQQELLAS